MKQSSFTYNSENEAPVLIKVWGWLANCHNCIFSSILSEKISAPRQISARMILIKILISWASAASVHGFQRAHFLVRETLQTFFKNGFSLGNLASAHHHHYHDRHAWQDHDASSPNREVFVRDLAKSIRFQTQVPGLPRGLF